jgi:hypothetical protein
MSKLLFPRRPTRRSLLVGAGALSLEATRLGSGVLLAGCGAPSTGGERVAIETRAKSDLVEGPVLENALGWSIELTKGRLALEHLYYVSGPPAGLVQRSIDAFGIRTAHAHPGHYDAGDVLAELPQPVTLDLLAPESSLGEGRGVTGPALSAVVTLGSLGGDDAALAAVIEGLASRDDAVISFRAEVERAAIQHPTSQLPEIDGCPLSGGPIESDGTVLLEVQVAVWLERIDFSEVPAAEEGRTLLEPGMPPHNAFQRGLVKAIGYQFSYFPV